MIISGTIILFLYALVIVSFLYGWKRIPFFKPPTFENTDSLMPISISVIVPARNEADNISQIMADLTSQNYPTENYEIIIIHDHSTDQTEELAKQDINAALNVKLFSLPDHLSGKKAAIRFGIQKAAGQLIVTTDADCRMGKFWLKTISDYYQQYHPVLISGPVSLTGYSIFEKLQQLEFLSLIASGAGAIGIHKPIMCNGANLIFEKQMYVDLSEELDEKYASGDDIFLLLAAKKKYKHRISFLKNPDALVLTPAGKSFSAFVEQRKRWVSKSKGYKDFDMIFVAVIVLLTNLFLAGTFVLALYNPSKIQYFLTAIFIKSIPDILLLHEITRFTNRKNLLWYFFPLQIMYSFYVLYTVFAGFFGTFTWKERIVKK